MHPNADRSPAINPGRGSCSLINVAPSCASVSASAHARGLSLPARGAAHECPHHRADDDEHDQRNEVVVLHDRERVDRRGEVVVGKQERHDRGQQRRQEPADGGDADDDEQVEQQHAREADVGAHQREEDREQRQRDRRDADRDEPTTARDPTCTGPGDARSDGGLFGLLGRDDVDVDVARRSQDLVDERSPEQVRPPRPAAGTEHELRRALGRARTARAPRRCRRPRARGRCRRRRRAAGDDVRAVSTVARRGRRSGGRARRAGRLAPRRAMRAARRISTSPPGAPVSATTMRSRVSHALSMPWSSRYCWRLSSTLSATQSSAISRNAVRFPTRK